MSKRKRCARHLIRKPSKRRIKQLQPATPSEPTPSTHKSTVPSYILKQIRRHLPNTHATSFVAQAGLLLLLRDARSSAKHIAHTDATVMNSSDALNGRAVRKGARHDAQRAPPRGRFTTVTRFAARAAEEVAGDDAARLRSGRKGSSKDLFNMVWMRLGGL